MSITIINTETTALTEGELRVMKVKRNKRFLFLLSSYLTIIAIFIYGLGPRYWLARHGISPSAPGNFGTRTSMDPNLVVKVIPPLFIFLVVVISYFIIGDFLKTAYKLHKDIVRGNKQLISFIPSKIPMPFFRRYFLNTPFEKKPEIEIDEKTFYSMTDNSYLVAEVAPVSQYIFAMRLNNELIEFS